MHHSASLKQFLSSPFYVTNRLLVISLLAPQPITVICFNPPARSRLILVLKRKINKASGIVAVPPVAATVVVTLALLQFATPQVRVQAAATVVIAAAVTAVAVIAAKSLVQSKFTLAQQPRRCFDPPQLNTFYHG